MEPSRSTATRLRNHPKLRWRGISTWPPQVGGAYGRGDEFPMLGDGVLEDVKILEHDLVGPRRLGVTVAYGGRKYSGQVPVDDPEVVTHLYAFLKTRVGRSLREIGD